MPIASLLAASLALAQQAPVTLPYSVLVTRDDKLVSEFHENKESTALRAFVKAKGLELRESKEGHWVLLDPRTYRDKVSDAFDTLGEVFHKNKGNEVIELAKLSESERKAVHTVIRKGHFGGEGFAYRLTQAPDLKIHLEPKLKMTLKRGDQSIDVHLGVGEDVDSEKLETKSLPVREPGMRFPLPPDSEQSAAEVRFVFSSFAPGPMRGKLAKLAAEHFAKESDGEEDRLNQIVQKMATAGFGKAWDGKTPIDMKNMDPGLRAHLAERFARQGMSLGFSSPEKAREWFNGASATKSEPTVTLWIGMRDGNGHLRSGFGIDRIK